MKKLFRWLLLGVLPGAVVAQTPPPVQVQVHDSAGVHGSFETQRDSIFRHLDPSPISSGILAERAFPIAALDRLSGQVAAADTADYGTFGRAYYLLRDGALPGVPSGLNDPETAFRAAALVAQADTSLPVGRLAGTRDTATSYATWRQMYLEFWNAS